MREPRARAMRERERLQSVIRSVRRRWRTRHLLRGGAVVMAAVLIALVVSVAGLEVTRFSPTAVVTFRWMAWGGVALALAFFVVRPLLRRVTDEQVALYLEEREPSLGASVLGAVEAERQAGNALSPELLDQLVRRAVERARAVENGRRIDQGALYKASGVLTGLTLATLVLLLFGPLGFRQGATALLPNRDAADVNPYAILVTPGDLTVARGSDQFIEAELLGFTSQEVSLFTRAERSESPQRLSMIPKVAGSGFEVLLVGLEEALEYFVESDGIRSATYRIEVVELPYVDRMDHEYRYPAFTGLPVREVEGAGDIAVLSGTRVRLTIHPTLETPGGRILMDGEEPADLEVQADGTLTGELTVRRRGFYRIELALQDGSLVPGSPEYTIDLITDSPPSIDITRPGRDTPVSPIEEVYVEAEAVDDYGIDELLLAYSVNGGPEDTLSLYSAGGRALGSVTAGHTLYLEDFEVEPGDLVSYYAFARDRRQGPGEEVVSDIYFLNIEPFRRDFRQAEQQGGSGGGGMGEGMEESLSELQKQVVAATFNLARDEDRYDSDEYAESVTAVALAQGRVRDQVATLAERMNNRGLTAAEDRFREIAEMLPEAVAAMEEAETRLRALEPREALAPEQQALRVIQKAEETYERYVGQQQQGGGGGGGGADAEDLADLFELELDQLQNQYETVQRGERQQANEEVDELLERLQELARRQQQEAERQRARSGQQQGNASAGGGSSAQSQRELADDAEETARQLQRLARETGDRDLAETARQLQEAADAMRRAAANAGSSGSAEAERALDRLEDAQRRLQQDREERLEEDVQSALDRVKDLREQQTDLQQRLDDLPTNSAERREAIREMVEEKGEMAGETARLRQDLTRLSQEAQSRDPETARELREAGDLIDDESITQKIQYSRGVIEMRDPEFARIGEEEIEENLEQLEEALRQASEAAGRMAGRQGLEESLEEAQDLQDRVASLNRRLADRTGAGEERAEGDPEGEGGSEGSQAQQGEQAGDPQGRGEQQTTGQQGQGDSQGAREGAQQGGGARGGAQAGDPSDGGGQAGGAVRGGREPLSPEEIRQFQRELQERLQDAAALRDELGAQGQDVGELEEAMQGMERLQDPRILQDLPQVALLQEAIRESLGRLEFTLRREVRGDAVPAALRGGDAVPDRFRRLVEEYYRRLARERGGN